MLTVINDPLVQHRLSLPRKIEIRNGKFHRLVRETSLLLGSELLRDLPLEPLAIEPPIEWMQAWMREKKLYFILRAAAEILEGILDLVPTAATKLKTVRARQTKFVYLRAAPEGVAAFGSAHPDVPVYAKALDRQLGRHVCILPGLDDAGDRLFNVK